MTVAGIGRNGEGMDKFAIYGGKDGNLRILVTVSEVGNTPTFEVSAFKDGVWVPVPCDKGTVAAGMLVFALLLQQPATLVAVHGQPEMPVWYVLEGTKGSALLARIYRRCLDTSSDLRVPAVRA